MEFTKTVAQNGAPYPTVGDVYSKINESAFAVLLSMALLGFFGLRYVKKSAVSILESDRASDFFNTMKQVGANQRALAEMQVHHIAQREQMDSLEKLIDQVHDRINQCHPLILEQGEIQQVMILQLKAINATLTRLEAESNPKE